MKSHNTATTRLALGTAQFGSDYGIANKRGQIRGSEARSILAAASSYGIDMLDTAVAYGECETMLGQLGVAGANIVTKLPELPRNCVDPEAWVLDAVENSLRRLRISCLYGVLLHRPEDLLRTSGAQLYSGLVRAKSLGLVEKLGISIYQPDELDSLCDRFRFDIVQAPFNVLDRRLLLSGWLTKLSVSGVELHARSVFLQGLLLMQPHTRPTWCANWQTIWDGWHDWLRRTGVTAVQACLLHVLSFEAIARVVVGVDSSLHLRELCEVIKSPARAVPESLSCDDLDLLSPTRWPHK